MEEDLLTVETLSKSVVAMSVEAWRFKKVFDRMLFHISPSERTRYASQYSWFNQKIKDALEQCGIKILNIEGQEYHAGVAAVPINMNEFSGDDILIVDQMLEPIIMSGERILKTGTVLLKKQKCMT